VEEEITNLVIDMLIRFREDSTILLFFLFADGLRLSLSALCWSALGGGSTFTGRCALTASGLGINWDLVLLADPFSDLLNNCHLLFSQLLALPELLLQEELLPALLGLLGATRLISFPTCLEGFLTVFLISILDDG
jgi:hypothetical protein